MATAHVNGMVFDYVSEGPDIGTPVVLLHGFPENHGCWAPLMAGLAAQVSDLIRTINGTDDLMILHKRDRTN